MSAAGLLCRRRARLIAADRLRGGGVIAAVISGGQRDEIGPLPASSCHDATPLPLYYRGPDGSDVLGEGPAWATAFAFPPSPRAGYSSQIAISTSQRSATCFPAASKGLFSGLGQLELGCVRRGGE